jgi:thiol:disulfide interchange protein
MKAAKCLMGLGWAMGLLALAGCGSGTSHSETSSVFQNLSLEQGLQQAQADGKVVMIDFYADWCGPCKMLDIKTWKDAKVQSWLRDNTVPVKINIDNASQLASKHNIQSIPQLVFLKPDGGEVGRLVGFHPPEEFLKKAVALVGEKKPATN